MDPELKPDFFSSQFFNTNECFLIQCKPYQTTCNIC